jgi:hypothetical protein
MPTRDVTNSQNLQALIDYIQGHGATTRTRIGYVQAGRFVLLGKGHSKTDTSQINDDDHYEGTLSLSINKNQLTIDIDGSLVQGGQKSKQNTSRSELETAIKKALAGMKWQPRLQWT